MGLDPYLTCKQWALVYNRVLEARLLLVGGSTLGTNVISSEETGPLFVGGSTLGTNVISSEEAGPLFVGGSTVGTNVISSEEAGPLLYFPA